MKLAKTHFIPVIALLGAAACTATTPQELLNARTAYDQASKGPAAQLAPADLHAAQESLGVAEKSFVDKGDSDETKDVAYAAERKAELADINARTVAANQQRTSALAQAAATKDQQAHMTAAQLAVANQQLAVQGQQLQDAERRAAQAAADLARVASVKQDARGMVITLSGAVLFASGKYELLPAAQAKLSEVATALAKQDPDSKIVVEGYTDSQGAQAMNETLSKNRAETVRSFLVSHGVASDRIASEGYGPAKPVADNASPEGRADNRRVEIVVQPPHKSNDMGMASPQQK